jgi:CRISPR-associated endonuclease/helicase Cas3
MSATVPEGLLGTVDNPPPAPGDVLSIEPEERTGELARRLDASRVIRRLGVEPGEYKEIAAAAGARHRAGTLTLVVLNTVDAARGVYKALAGQPVRRMLLHSRFRGVDRTQLMKQLIEATGDAGRIVVATQVVEAGIDLNAAVLITEAAPWPSVVQRAGRCNRTGGVPGAEFWWVPPAKALPYEQADTDATAAELESLEGYDVTSEMLLARNVAVTETPVAVLRRSDFTALFDTAPDLSGADLDIAPYVRDTDDLDVQLAWATWTSDTKDGRPSAEQGVPPAPPAEFRCRVPLHKLSEFQKKEGVTIWRLDQVLGRWTRVDSRARARPGEVLLVSADSGGYDPELGFDPAARGPVPSSPALGTTADPATGAEDVYRADSASVEQPAWVSLERHSQEARDQASKLLSALEPELPPGAGASAVTAAYVHDVGKAHEVWQNALCELALPERKDEIDTQRPWAKSGGKGRLRFAGGAAFRHELASLLMLDGPLRDLLADVPDPDLARYLVLAHHGKLRVQVRDPGDLAILARANGGTRDQASASDRAGGPSGGSDVPTLLGLKHGSADAIPALLGQPASTLTVDLDQFSLGGEHSWTRTALSLRERYGPFVLAYLETIVRIADWRASGPAATPATPAVELASTATEATR